MKSPAGSTTWLPTEHQIYCLLIATPSKEPSIPAPLQHGLPSCENTHGSRTRSYDNPPERRIRTHSRWIKADRIPHPKIWFHTSCYQDIAKTAEAPIFVYFIANDSRTKSSCFSPSISNRTYHHSYNPHIWFSYPETGSNWGVSTKTESHPLESVRESWDIPRHDQIVRPAIWLRKKIRIFQDPASLAPILKSHYHIEALQHVVCSIGPIKSRALGIVVVREKEGIIPRCPWTFLVSCSRSFVGCW